MSQDKLTPDEKQAFVKRVQAEQAAFLAPLRTVHSQDRKAPRH